MKKILCKCFNTPMSSHGMEGYISGHTYFAAYFKKRGKRSAYYNVYLPDNSYCSCGPIIFKKYFLIEDSLDNVNSVRASVVEIANTVYGKHGITSSHIERAFGLDKGTISKYAKAIKDDQGVGALLRVILCFPWIVDIAEHNYNHAYTNRAIILQGSEVMKEIANKMIK